MSESQWRDRDWKSLNLNDETNTQNVWVSMTRPRTKRSESQWRDWDWKCLSFNDETGNMQVSMTRPRPRLKIYESLWRDQKNLSLNNETETEKMRVWAKDVDNQTPLRLLLISELNSVWFMSSDNCKIGGSGFFLTYRANSAIWIGNKWNDFDWTDLVRLDSFCLDFLVWMTQGDFDILWRMLRQRLIETRIYVGCHDRASSRLIILDVETQESSRLRNFLSRPRPVETGQKTPSRRSLIFALKHGSCYQAIFF